MKNLDTVIAAYECFNNNNFYQSNCDSCPYGYNYLDERGDGRPFWCCNEEELTNDMYTWLKIYQHLTEEQN